MIEAHFLPSMSNQGAWLSQDTIRHLKPSHTALGDGLVVAAISETSEPLWLYLVKAKTYRTGSHPQRSSFRWTGVQPGHRTLSHSPDDSDVPPRLLRTVALWEKAIHNLLSTCPIPGTVVSTFPALTPLFLPISCEISLFISILKVKLRFLCP